MEGEQFGDKIDYTYYPPFWYGFANTVLATSFLTLSVVVTIVSLTHYSCATLRTSLKNLYKAIRLHENFSKWTSYQIMFFISVCDIAQLVIHVFSGVSLMLEWEMPYLLNIVSEQR
uniref:Serpentine receptor class gamma n=1 Tax=Angiostrongylus cantonensis TaxID=6313 RepID=A0A0K0DIV8_ANGCA